MRASVAATWRCHARRVAAVSSAAEAPRGTDNDSAASTAAVDTRVDRRDGPAANTHRSRPAKLSALTRATAIAFAATTGASSVFTSTAVKATFPATDESADRPLKRASRHSRVRASSPGCGGRSRQVQRECQT